MQTILGLFGYVKIPLAAVQLSVAQEAYFEGAYRNIPEEYPKQKAYFKQYVDAQHAITEFLRSGRKLNR